MITCFLEAKSHIVVNNLSEDEDSNQDGVDFYFF